MAAVFEGQSAEVLYNEMREAINKKNHQQMKEIISKKDYLINKVGGNDKRTALHTATMAEDKEALRILLECEDVDTNVKTTHGLTPFLLAAAKGKMVSFEILLADKRVNEKEKDGDDQSALELVEALGQTIKLQEAQKLLRSKSQSESNFSTDEGKLALLIGNCTYQKESGLSNLPGAKRDLKDMQMKLEADGYKVEILANSEDILTGVEEVMEKQPDYSISMLQILYVGKFKLSQMMTFMFMCPRAF